MSSSSSSGDDDHEDDDADDDFADYFRYGFSDENDNDILQKPSVDTCKHSVIFQRWPFPLVSLLNSQLQHVLATPFKTVMMKRS